MSAVSFIVKDKDGNIVRYGTCEPDMVAHQAIAQGETAEIGVPDPEAMGTITYNHIVPRAMMYPDLAEQIGSIWKVLEKNPDVLDDEARAILSRIAAVKAAIPKGEQFVQEPGVGFRKI